MKKVLTWAACAAALAIGACAHPTSPARVTIEQVEAAYAEAKALASLLTPYLSADRLAQLAALKRRIDAAIAAAKAARTVVDRARALEEAQAATLELGR